MKLLFKLNSLLFLLFWVVHPSPTIASSIQQGNPPQIAKWYLEDDIIRVDTENKTISIPNSLVVMAGKNQSKAFGFTGGAIFSYDVEGVGNGCKIIFNPSKLDNNSKFYVVAREHPLGSDEYYFCGIILNPFHLDVPSEKVVIDGMHPRKSKDNGNNSVIYYGGEKLQIPSEPSNMLACEFIGDNVMSNDILFNGQLFYAQGMAVYQNYLFRLGYEVKDKRNLCQVFDVSDTHNVKLINRFYLGYKDGYAHANTCQFGMAIDPQTGFPLLYTRNGDKHACIVERVSLNRSEVVQRINIDYKDIFPHGGGEGNTVIGDDGCIWYFGESNGVQYFAKFRTPSLDRKEVTLSIKDIVDSWEIPVRDSYENRTWQGGKVKGGRIYFLYGISVDTSRLYIIDIDTKRIITLIPLSSIIEEVEDLDFTKDGLLIGISSHKNGIYKLSEIAY